MVLKGISKGERKGFFGQEEELYKLHPLYTFIQATNLSNEKKSVVVSLLWPQRRVPLKEKRRGRSMMVLLHLQAYKLPT